MSLKFLSKVLPTSENSIAYTHMILSNLNKETGIRKRIPNLIDVRVNAFIIMLLSTADILITGTRLSLHVIFIIPFFTTDKPIIKDFICSIATFVKAALAILHGQNEGLLPYSNYELLQRGSLKDIDLAKKYLSTLPLPANANEETFLKNMIARAGLNESINYLLENKKFDILVKVVELFKAKTQLLNAILNNNFDEPDRIREMLFQIFSCDSNTFVISVLMDETVPEDLKYNLQKLSQIQTNINDGVTAQNQVVQNLENYILEYPLLLETARKKKSEILKRFSDRKEALGINDDSPHELPQELLTLQDELFAASRKVSLMQPDYNQKETGLISILNLNPALILTTDPQVFEKITLKLKPSLHSLKELSKQPNNGDMDALFQKAPHTLAKSVDSKAGDSFIMYLLSEKKYDKALQLLKLDSEQLNRKTVIDLLKSGQEYFQISQEEMEKILAENHEDFVNLYKEHAESTVKMIDAMPKWEDQLQAIGVGLCGNGGSVRNEGVSMLDSLLRDGVFTMVHKQTAQKRVVLEDIPAIGSIYRSGLALATSVGAWSFDLASCLSTVSGIPELNIMTKHIIQRLREKNDPEVTRNVLNFYATGAEACNARKQNVVTTIWNEMLDERFEKTEDANKKKLDSFLSTFKEKIAMRILPADSHARAAFGLTLYNERHVEIARAGNRDYYGNYIPQRSHTAIRLFDQAYQPHDFVAFLREAMKDDRNKLKSGISDVISEFLTSLVALSLKDALAPALQAKALDLREKMDLLIFDFNGEYTDFALFCVLIHLGYIKMRQ